MLSWVLLFCSTSKSVGLPIGIPSEPVEMVAPCLGRFFVWLSQTCFRTQPRNKGATHFWVVEDSVGYSVAGQAECRICENWIREVECRGGTVMARMPRKFVVDDDEVGVYHCINRCVRRAFLCGTDEVSGQCFDHRKQFIQDRLEFLAGVFGIDVLAFAVMSNHLHVVLRNRPDVVRLWSDDEVARRWWNLFPSRRDESGEAAVPQDSDLSMITADAEKLAEIRRRL
jgi:REP element-mobilizing transposase RayT